jgi:mono/diheme cytochrome c family protein
MHSRSALHAGLVVALLVCPTGSRSADPGPVDFDRDVKPIFAKHCTSCHGAERSKGGLRLDRRADALGGGDGGKVIVPGKSADSPLVKLVTHDDPDMRMPPKGPRLTGPEVATLRAWIDQGANGPDDAARSDPGAGGGEPGRSHRSGEAE